MDVNAERKSKVQKEKKRAYPHECLVVRVKDVNDSKERVDEIGQVHE